MAWWPTTILPAAMTTILPTATAVPDKDGRFTLTCTDLAAGKGGELRLFFLEANGIPSGFLSHTPYTYSYNVRADGTADVSAIEAGLLLKPLTATAPTGKGAEEAFKAIDFSKSEPVMKAAAASFSERHPGYHIPRYRRTPKKQPCR